MDTVLPSLVGNRWDGETKQKLMWHLQLLLQTQFAQQCEWQEGAQWYEAMEGVGEAKALFQDPQPPPQPVLPEQRNEEEAKSEGDRLVESRVIERERNENEQGSLDVDEGESKFFDDDPLEATPHTTIASRLSHALRNKMSVPPDPQSAAPLVAPVVPESHGPLQWTTIAHRPLRANTAVCGPRRQKHTAIAQTDDARTDARIDAPVHGAGRVADGRGDDGSRSNVVFTFAGAAQKQPQPQLSARKPSRHQLQPRPHWTPRVQAQAFPVTVKAVVVGGSSSLHPSVERPKTRAIDAPPAAADAAVVAAAAASILAAAAQVTPLTPMPMPTSLPTPSHRPLAVRSPPCSHSQSHPHSRSASGPPQYMAS